MSVVGFFVGGPYNLIAATVAADLGSQPALAGNAEALSTVTGLIDGTGSVGSAIGQAIVPVMDDKLGWSYVFYLFIVMVSKFVPSTCTRWGHLPPRPPLPPGSEGGAPAGSETEPQLGLGRSPSGV